MKFLKSPEISDSQSLQNSIAWVSVPLTITQIETLLKRETGDETT